MGQITTWKKTCIKFIKYTESRLWANTYSDFCFARIISLQEKNVVAITDSFNVQCLYLYLINILTKSTKAEKCTDIRFKLTIYCLSVTLENLNL